MQIWIQQKNQSSLQSFSEKQVKYSRNQFRTNGPQSTQKRRQEIKEKICAFFSPHLMLENLTLQAKQKEAKQLHVQIR